MQALALDLPQEGAQALVVQPRGPTRAAAVVNHGNPGVPAYLRRLAEGLAAAGVATAVLAGDGRLEPRRVADVSAEERARWRTEEFADGYLATTRELVTRVSREHEDVALVGFCGGGWQAVRLAAEGLPVSRVAALHAALRFPAEDPRDDLLSYLPRARVPLQFHFGGADSHTPASDIDALRTEVRRLGLTAEIHVYRGAGHGFLDPDEHQDGFDETAAELAARRLVEFLS